MRDEDLPGQTLDLASVTHAVVDRLRRATAQVLRRRRLMVAISGDIDISAEQAKQIYQDIRNKRRTTPCLHRKPALLEDLAEISV